MVLNDGEEISNLIYYYIVGVVCRFGSVNTIIAGKISDLNKSR